MVVGGNQPKVRGTPRSRRPLEAAHSQQCHAATTLLWSPGINDRGDVTLGEDLGNGLIGYKLQYPSVRRCGRNPPAPTHRGSAESHLSVLNTHLPVDLWQFGEVPADKKNHTVAAAVAVLVMAIQSVSTYSDVTRLRERRRRSSVAFGCVLCACLRYHLMEAPTPPTRTLGRASTTAPRNRRRPNLPKVALVRSQSRKRPSTKINIGGNQRRIDAAPFSFL